MLNHPDQGFQIEHPPIFVPWGITESQLEIILNGQDLFRIKSGYWTMNCIALNGLKLNIGFHFDSKENPTLKMVGFNIDDVTDINQSYTMFQEHLEATFGKSTYTKPGKLGLLTHVWRFRRSGVYHVVFDRFGIEQRIVIEQLPKQTWRQKLIDFLRRS